MTMERGIPKMKAMRGFKKGDIVLVLIIGFIALVPLLWSYYSSGSNQSGNLKAVVIRDGKRITEIDLNKVQEPQRIHFEDGIKTTILAEKGQIKFLEADCPDQICVKTGTLTKQGDRAVCLPGKTIVLIEDNGNQL